MSVPDSPEDPANAAAGTTATATSSRAHKSKCLLSLCKYKTRGTKTEESRLHHGHWPGTRIRVLFRVFGQWGNQRRTNRQQYQPSVAVARTNQVVPLAGEALGAATPENGVAAVSARVPALPPPQRRRLSSNEQVLVDALSLVAQRPSAPARPLRHPLPPYYRRRRRSLVHHRPKTPTLSPIRESGLSNPASPSRQNECGNSISLIAGSCSNSQLR